MGSIRCIILLLLFPILFFQSSHSNKALVDSSSSSRCIESERKALAEFKASLVRETSNVSSLPSWTGRDCCLWKGITCHNLTHHVQRLDLGHALTGLNVFNSSLSPWLFNLTHLEVLNMSSSNLMDSIPNMFYKLTSLTTLDLSWTSLNSVGFLDSLCTLTNLTHIDLSVSSLHGSLPLCLGNLTSLTILNLNWNKLSGEIPGGLGHLKRLTTLDLSYNQFNSSIPSSLGNLQDLQSLNLAYNQLSGVIPSNLGKLHDLESLNLAHNHLSGVIPSNLRNRLYASHNSLTGELSELFFEGSKSLKELEISKNQYFVLNVSPQWIPPFQMLNIQMDSVYIGTPFPPWLQTQGKLEKLYMSNASISGAIPDWCLTAFPNLTGIAFSNNLLTGSVPAFDNANLVNIQLSGNKLSGKIPQQLCNLKSLKALSLANNQLTGTIPSCLGALQELFVLDLGNNSLSGHIPNLLGSLFFLGMLHLNGNKLSGKLPASWQSLPSLTTLDLGDNELQGHLPPWIGENWGSLEYLRLESNNFSGEIPVNFCQFPELHILNLAMNNLAGMIPSCLGSLSMKLSNEGGIRSYGGFGFSYDEALLNIINGREMVYTSSLPYARFISLSGNHLHGEIPVELMNLTGLKSLNLSNNELNGIIPEEINNLKQLQSLDLSMNRLSGTIPQSLTEIDALSSLNLSFNNLAGKIPSGNHFDTLDDPSIYEGNVGLCGKILMKSCPGEVSPISNLPTRPVPAAAGDEFDQLSWLYAGIGPGYAVGFLGVICSLYFQNQWRFAVFGFANKMYNLMK